MSGVRSAPGSKGRWPEKATRVFINLLENAEANAEHRNLEPEKMVIQHIQVNRAPKMRRRTYRAHGRINAYMSSPAHIELICVDEGELVRKAEEEEPSQNNSRRSRAQRRIRARGD